MADRTAGAKTIVKPSSLPARIASAALMIPVAVAAVWFGGIAFSLLVFLAGCLMLWEWLRLPGNAPQPMINALAFGILGSALIGIETGRIGASVLVFAAGALLVGAFARRQLWPIIGLFYVGLPSMALVWLRGDPDHGRLMAFWLFAVVWATDTGAYAFGRMIGGPKLIPALSPNKTWAGLGGGMLCAGLAGAAVASLDSSLPAVLLGGFAAATAVIAQAGDFFESGVKRHFGVKDMSNLIPGHGGALDRLDGLLFASPWVAAGFAIWGRQLWP